MRFQWWPGRAGRAPGVSGTALLMLVLAGCATVPPEQRQAVESSVKAGLPTAWASGEVDGDVVQGGLLALSRDVGLQAWTRHVLARNAGIRQSVLDVRIAEMGAERAGLAHLPTVTATAGTGRNRTQGAGGRGQYANSVSLSGTVSWEADIWGKLADRQQAAKANMRAARHDLAAARLSTAAEAMRNWVDLVTLDHLIRLDQARITSLGQTENIVRERFQRGLGALSDLETARAETENARAVLLDRQLQRADLNRRMEILGGDLPRAMLAVSVDLPDFALPGQVLPATVLGRRPDVVAAYARAVAASAEATASYKDVLPTFSIDLTISSSGSNLANLFTGGPVWSLLGNLTARLLDGGNRRTRAAEADMVAARSWLDYRRTLLQALSEVESRRDAELNFRQRIEVLNRQLTHALASRDQFRRRYADGLTDIITLLTAQRTAFDARQSLISARADRLKNRINLALSLGVGI